MQAPLLPPSFSYTDSQAKATVGIPTAGSLGLRRRHVQQPDIQPACHPLAPRPPSLSQLVSHRVAGRARAYVCTPSRAVGTAFRALVDIQEGKSRRKPLLSRPLLSSSARRAKELGPRVGPAVSPHSRARLPGQLGTRRVHHALECVGAPDHPSSRVFRIGEAPGWVASLENRRRQGTSPGPGTTGQGHERHCGSNTGQQGDLGRWFHLITPVCPPVT